jgi:peptidoglycan/LPS O-acetylase OafA/YrhL
MSAILSSDGAKRALEAAPLQWLGKISFSLYLTHIVVLLTMFHLFWGHASAFVLIIAIIAGSLGTAVLLHVSVEKPFAALGSRLRSRTALKVDQHQGI